MAMIMKTRNEVLTDFAVRLKQAKPSLVKVLKGEPTMLEGIRIVAKVVGYPDKIRKADRIDATLNALWEYIEDYREETLH